MYFTRLFFLCPSTNKTSTRCSFGDHYTTADRKCYHPVKKDVIFCLGFGKLKSFMPFEYNSNTSTQNYIYYCHVCSFVFDNPSNLGVCPNCRKPRLPCLISSFSEFTPISEEDKIKLSENKLFEDKRKEGTTFQKKRKLEHTNIDNDLIVTPWFVNDCMETSTICDCNTFLVASSKNKPCKTCRKKRPYEELKRTTCNFCDFVNESKDSGDITLCPSCFCNDLTYSSHKYYSGYKLDSLSNDYWESQKNPKKNFDAWQLKWSKRFRAPKILRIVQKQWIEKNILSLAIDIDCLTESEDVLKYAISLLQVDLLDIVLVSRLRKQHEKIIEKGTFTCDSRDNGSDEWSDTDFGIKVSSSFQNEGNRIMLNLEDIVRDQLKTNYILWLFELVKMAVKQSIPKPLVQIIFEFLGFELDDIEVLLSKMFAYCFIE
jgi:hypothetical protein